MSFQVVGLDPAAFRLPTAFNRLVLSSLAAQCSEQVALATAPLAAVLMLGVGAAETGLLQTAQTLPFLLLSLPLGVLADRRSRRGLMAGAEAVRAVSLLLILLLLVVDALSLPWLAGLGFLGAVGTVAYSVAAPAVVPALVPREQLAGANRWLELARSSAFAAGPAVGGAVVGWTGASGGYVLATVLSLIAVVLLSRLPEWTPADRIKRNVVQELREAAAFVFGHRLLRPVLITAVFFNTAWFILQAIYVAYAVERLGLTALGVGVTLGSYGAGMVTGAVLAPQFAARLPFGLMVATGPLSALVASLVMLSTLVDCSALPAALAMFLFGAGPILWTITTTTLRQSVTPPNLLGRVSAVILAATFGTRPIGAAIGALLAARFGADVCLLASTVGFAAQFAILVISPVRRLARQPETDLMPLAA